ncbi:MAG: hypothetical protein J7448_01695 [Thermomicrobium sp.]|nr:hypothetical protein [Thermomicrobium sp.]
MTSLDQGGLRSQTRFPLSLVAITGTRGKSTTAWLLYRMVRAQRWSAGLWCSSGVFVDERQLEGELQPWTSVVQALRTGDLDLAIQELEAPVVATVGLPAAIYRAGAVTTLCGNDDSCLLAPATRYAARAHEIVARAIHPHGFIVLNADDPDVLGLAEESLARVIFFALHPENPVLRRQRDARQPAIWYDDGVIVANRALYDYQALFAWDAQTTESDAFSAPSAFLERVETRTEPDDIPVIAVREAPITLGGALLFQVQNVLCATALALGLGISLTAIRSTLRTFLPTHDLLPGSCNLVFLRDLIVLIDGARDLWTLRTLLRGVRQSTPHKVFVVTHGFPWLSQEDLREVGRILGRVTGMILISEPLGDERLAAFREGVVENVLPPVIVTQPDLPQALQTVLTLARPGDLCLVLASDPLKTGEIVRRIIDGYGT